MSIVFQRNMLVLSVLVLILSLAGCQQVSDARAEFCTDLRDIGAKAVDLKKAKVDDPVSKYQGIIDNQAAKKKNIESLGEADTDRGCR